MSTGNDHGSRAIILFLLLMAPSAAPADDPAVVPHLDFIFDASDVVSGGAERRTEARWLLDAGATFDLERLAGLRGGTFFAGMLYQDGDDGSAAAGDIQAYSNIDAGNFGDIYMFWYEQRLRDDRIRFKAGKIDANEEFAVVDSAGEFLNSSAGYSPTIFPLPTYPEPEYGLNLFFRLRPGLTLGAGAFDTSDSTFAIAEAGYRWNREDRGRPGSVKIGAWRDSGDYERFDGTTERSPGGLYAVLEQEIGDGLDLFAQVGASDEKVAEIGRHYSAGIASRGLFSGREDDTAGLMVTHVDLSDHPEAGFDGDETAIELFYGIRINDHLALKPDLQYIANPSGDPTVDDALVGTVRIEISF